MRTRLAIGRKPMSTHESATFDEATRALVRKYRVTAWLYDILDYPWERQYRRWRPSLLAEVSGTVVEAGGGTGRNLRHYPPGADVTAFDLSPSMVRIPPTYRSRPPAQGSGLFALGRYNPPLPSNHFD